MPFSRSSDKNQLYSKPPLPSSQLFPQIKYSIGLQSECASTSPSSSLSLLQSSLPQFQMPKPMRRPTFSLGKLSQNPAHTTRPHVCGMSITSTLSDIFRDAHPTDRSMYHISSVIIVYSISLFSYSLSRTSYVLSVNVAASGLGQEMDVKKLLGVVAYIQA